MSAYDWHEREIQETCKGALDMLLDGPPGRQLKLTMPAKDMTTTIRTMQAIATRAGYGVHSAWQQTKDGKAEVVFRIYERRVL